jgi:predicted ribosomally synthesized peptide with SipW-like signal peptide
MKRKRKSLVVMAVALVAAIAGMAVTYSAFTSTTQNDGNTFEAGTVVLNATSPGSALMTMSEMAPGSTQTRCVNVSYTGSLDANVKLYGATTAGTNGDLSEYLDVEVTRGTGSTTPDCAGFAADADGALYTGTLKDYPAGFAAGVADPKVFHKDDAVVYQVKATLKDDNDAQGKGASTDLKFEARNVAVS